MTTSKSLAGEPGQAVISIFDQLINRIKQNQPVRSDDKPLGGGYVYEMLPLGQPIDPDDFRDPWTPQGSTVQAATNLPAPPSSAGAATPPAGTAATAPALGPDALRSLAAAYKTAVLATKLLQVTTGNTYLEYPTGQHLDFQYNGILMGMQAAAPNEADDPAVVAAVAAARKVLFQQNPNGTYSVEPTDRYQNYQDNTIAYGTAVAAYAQAYAQAQSDPAVFAAFPVTSRTYQNAVNQAKNRLISEGGPDVEKALDTLASVGNPIQAHMIAQARAIYDAWNLGLAGAVPASIPYSFISPSGWAKLNDKQGWTNLTVSSSQYQHVDSSHASQSGSYSWLNKASSSSGGGGVFFGFGAVTGKGSTSSSSHDDQSSQSNVDYSHFKNSAKNLSISIWYALIEVERPWLMSDLFYMDNWYLKGYAKGHISTGKVADQVGSATHSMPMIPKQMLVIKDVQISSMDWGDDGAMLTSLYGRNQHSSSSTDSSVSGSAGVCLGPISFGGSASHSSSSQQGDGSSFNAQNSSGYFNTTFNGQTLHIPGAQIIAWLCDVVPLCPPLDDPELGKTVPAAG